MLSKPKDKRSVFDLRAMVPFIKSPGPHMMDYLRFHKIKEKDIYNISAGLQLESFEAGEYILNYGIKEKERRKTYILIEGEASVLIPEDPEEMLKTIQNY